MTSSGASNNLELIRYTNLGGSNPHLKVLDQLLVPHEKVYIDVPDVDTAYSVIKTMQIRGMCTRNACGRVGM